MTYCDQIIENAYVVTVDKDWHTYENGFLATRGNEIVGVGPMEQSRLFSATTRLDASGQILIPGFVNTHTHIAMAAFRGASEDVQDRLNRYIFPMERDLVRPELVYNSSLYCLAEMLLSGTTTFADMYYFEDEVAQAAQQAGLRAILGETVLGQPAPDAYEPNGGLTYARSFIRKWKGNDLVSPAIAPHAPYTVDEENLRRSAQLAREMDVPLLMHVAEMDHEHVRFSQSHGSVLRYLDTIGLLNERLIAAHMLYLDDEDIQRAKDRGVRVAHAPVSNAKSGRPICPAWRMMQAGVKLGLATDGPLSGNSMDIPSVLSLFPKLQKTREENREILTAKEAFRTATLGGAEVLGLETQIGSLEVGKKADFILIDGDDFNMQPIYDIYATLVYALKSHNVQHVYVNGRPLVKDRRIMSFNAEKVKIEMKNIRDTCRGYIAAINSR